MKIVFGLALAFAVGMAAPAAAQAPAAAIPVDDGYVLALSAADNVMHAWVTRDAALGRALLTPAALKRYSAADVTSLFQGTSSPRHESFEIGPGHKLSPTKYSFDVVEYEYLTNMNFKGPRPRPVRLVVVEVSPGTWLVDELPRG